jgi:hypothetical protein
MRWWLELPLSSIVELWNSVWGVLGPAIIAALILYIRHPEKFEKIIVHVARFLSLFSGEFEKKAVAREVSYIVSSEFAKSYRIEEVPKVLVEWGEEDKALLDLERNLLLIVLRRRKYRHENVARALLKTIRARRGGSREKEGDRSGARVSPLPHCCEGFKRAGASHHRGVLSAFRRLLLLRGWSPLGGRLRWQW